MQDVFGGGRGGGGGTAAGVLGNGSLESPAGFDTGGARETDPRLPRQPTSKSPTCAPHHAPPPPSPKTTTHSSAYISATYKTSSSVSENGLYSTVRTDANTQMASDQAPHVESDQTFFIFLPQTDFFRVRFFSFEGKWIPLQQFRRAEWKTRLLFQHKGFQASEIGHVALRESLYLFSGLTKKTVYLLLGA